MNNLVLVVYIIVSALIIFLVLIQGKGAGLGSAWGGGGEFFQTRRGVEKVTLRILVFLIVIFFLLSVWSLISR